MALRFMVGEVPRTKPFQFADLAELTLLVGLNSQVSKADLESLIISGREDSDPDPEESHSDVIQTASIYARNTEDCFKQFSYRSGALDEAYPFLTEGALLVPKDNIGPLGYVYLFCLICSRLGSFKAKKGFAQQCAKLFTELSSIALKAFLREGTNVYIFDAGSEDRKQHFHTDLRQALKKLGVMLNARSDDDLIDQQSPSGDGGLDLVAMNAMGDTAKGVLAYFGQCAAQQNGWPKKTLEARRSCAFFSMGHRANNLLYTPVMYRNTTGKWVNDLFSEDCIIVDRLRLMRAMETTITEMPAQLFDKIRTVVYEVANSSVE